MSLVITAIFFEKFTKEQDFQTLSNFIESLEDVQVTEVKTLSESRCFDFFINYTSTKETAFTDLKEQLQQRETELFLKVDLILQRNNELRKGKKLFCFDMDSTLIYQEVIELIAAYAGVEDQVEAITTRAMNGELDFKQSLNERVALLKGINSTTIWDELKEKLQFTKGDFELMKFLKSKGTKLAVLSGGFINLASYVKEQLQLDYAFANLLETDSDGVLTGKTVGEIVDGDKKAELTLQIAKENDIKPEEAVCVGDGSNDLKMMGIAGFGVAWNAKPIVQKKAPGKLNTEKISDILYILGYTDEEINQV
ncbi:hypothetical protein WICPIJ_009672 [Wickerhamomyces pijperi]|uniref:phosphoserine phosphatase n=1 Tax=Wickerhamomyces pijperi TaxID=599730 RepID=A0A9P8TCZ6_WICPI|nr:hypothetical protein WICPIJ_009672 [Wickerhamomyces pijperi]